MGHKESDTTERPTLTFLLGLHVATFILSPHRASAQCLWGERTGRQKGHSSSWFKATKPVGLGYHPYDISSVQFSRSVVSDSL